MEAAYAAAARLLRDRMTALGRPAPEPIPLRLREEEGLLLSALARSAGTPGEALAQALVQALPLEGTPFARAEAQRGLVLLRLSQDWLEQVLAWYARAPWPEPERAEGLMRQDRTNPAFLRGYTLRRCKRLAAGETSDPFPRPTPVGLICLLARGPGGSREAWAGEVARRYWRLTPTQRRSSLLAGAVGRAAGGSFDGSFTKNSPNPPSMRYNNKKCCVSPWGAQGLEARETRSKL